MRIRFDKIDRFFRIYDGNKCLVLLVPENYDAIYNRITYLISIKSSITDVFAYYYAKIKVDSYDSLPISRILILHNVINVIKSVLNKDKYHCYYNIFFEKCSWQIN